MDNSIRVSIERYVNAHTGHVAAKVIEEAYAALVAAAAAVSAPERQAAAAEVWREHLDVPPYDMVHEALARE